MAREPLKVLTESMFYVLLSLLRQERCGTDRKSTRLNSSHSQQSRMASSA